MYPDAAAYAIADAHEVVNVVDLEATLRVAESHRIDGIIADTSDVSVPTAAFVAERLGLPGIGYETALNCTNKARLRDCCSAAGLQVPDYCVIDGALPRRSTPGLPVIVKPVDNQSGRGVSVVRSASDLDEAVDTARRFSRSGKVLVERLLVGTEVIVDGIVLDGEPTVLGISSKAPNAENPTVSTSIAYPADLAPSALDLIRVTNRKALHALGLKRGPFHAEYFVTQDAVIPIDIAARGGGVHIYRLVIPHVSGFDLPVAAVRLALGEKVQLTACAASRAAVVEFLQAPPGVIRRIHGVADAESLPGIAIVYLRVAPGDVVRPLCDKDARPGHLVAVAESLSEARERAALARDLIRFDVDPTENQATKE